MPLYRYKAIDPAGRPVRGQLEAANVADLETRLRRRELDLVTGRPLGQRRLVGRGKVARRELIHFCFHLEHLLRAGVRIVDGLTDLRDSLEQPRFREIIADLVEAIEGGRTLSQAMKSHETLFGPVFISLIHAGEASGRLPEVLQGLSETLKWEDELASQTKKLLIYPALVGTIVTAAAVFLMLYMVPQLKQFVKNMGQTLPAQTKALFFVSDFLAAYWPAVLSLFGLLGLGLKILPAVIPAVRLWLDGAKLQIPLFGKILRKIILARFANTFAMLYTAKVSILESIRIGQDVVGNQRVRRGLMRVEQGVIEGKNLTAAFQSTGFFPPLVIRMLRVGENSGALGDALANVGYFYSRDVRESVEKLQQLIEPLLTVMLGVLLGWIMLSVLGPVYDVITQLKV